MSELDDRGEPVTSIFWAYLLEEEYGRLFVGLRGAAKGRRAAFGRLLGILREAGLGLVPSDITIFDSEEDSSLPPQARVIAATFLGRPTPVRSWAEFDDAIVYCWTDAATTARLTPPIPQDRVEELWEEFRKQHADAPRLLFDVKASAVTIRFHPVHGPRLADLADIKPLFETAVGGEALVEWE